MSFIRFAVSVPVSASVFVPVSVPVSFSASVSHLPLQSAQWHQRPAGGNDGQIMEWTCHQLRTATQ